MAQDLIRAKARFVELCEKLGKVASGSRLLENVLTISITDSDFAGPFEGNGGGRFITVMGRSISVRRLVEGANAYSIGVYELLADYQQGDRVYPKGHQSLKAVGIVSEE